VQEVADEEATPTSEEALRAELSEWQNKATEYLDGWQRARADFVNYKKRMEREQALAHQNASAMVIKRFLDVLDDLERALKNRPAQGDGASWAEGIDLIYRKLNNILETSGVLPIEAAGKQFDPTEHEAISHEPVEGYESGQVIEVIKQGYKIEERVLRPALVRVAK
jgi:molecular chaperone GrpE